MQLKTVISSFWDRMQQSKWVQNHRRTLLIGGISLVLLLVIGHMVVAFLDKGVKFVAVDPDKDINIKTNLTFAFSADAVGAEQVGATLTKTLIKFNPHMPGRFRWISRRELRFLPEAPFQPSTEYEAELQSELVTVKDRFLSGKRKIKFNSELFKVEGISVSFAYPETRKKGLHLQASLNFNYPVDATELQKALEIKFVQSKQEIRYNLSTTGKNNNFVLTSELLQMEDQDKKIELTIPKGFRCAGGNIGLADTYTQTAVLGAKKPLTVIEAIPKNGETKCWIAVHCSEAVEAKDLTGFIRLKPEVSFKVQVEGDYILIKSDRFKSGESYNLRLAPGLPSFNGYPLKREFSATVVFTDLEPSLRFNSPGRYLSSKGNLNLGLETVNIDKVNLEISQIYANNIVSYLNSTNDGADTYSSYVERLGRIAKSEILNIDAPKNEMVTTPINLKEYLTG
ncbi:MAG TPA: hypothetical protein VEC37_09685, partial [Bacillota bacterium]|nr:hypothetical protein [Bacillota bacterium]